MGWTQTQLGERVGLGLRAIQKLEDNMFPKFKRDSIIAIDKVLGTNLCELVYEQDIHIAPNKGQKNPLDMTSLKKENNAISVDLDMAKGSPEPLQNLLEKLINSNYLLAQANNTKAEADKIKAEADRINAEATMKIVATTEKLTDLVKADSDAQKGTDSTAFAIRAELLELQARLNKSDGLSRSLGEARSKVNRVFAEMKKDKAVIRNEDELGKIDKKTPA